jgi:hypothetical protein
MMQGILKELPRMTEYKNVLRLAAFFLIISGSFLFFGIGKANAATYYVTQSGAGDSSGSSYANAMSAATFNAKSDFVSDDVIYLCDTFTGISITPRSHGNAGHPIVIRGDYSGHPGIIDGNNSITNGIYSASASVHDITIANLDVKNTTSTGISLSVISAATTANFILDNCNVYNIGQSNAGGEGIILFGSGNKIIDNTISYTGGDGIYVQGDNVEIGHNTIGHVSMFGSQDVGGGGDCIQLGSFYSSSNFWAHDNYCDHSDIDAKSCVIVENAINPLIEKNTCIGSRIGLLSINSTGVITRYNSVAGAFQNGIEVTDSDGSWYYNVINGGCGSDSAPGAILTGGSNTHTMSFYDNTIYNVNGFGFYSDNSSSSSVINFENNIVSNTGGFLLAYEQTGPVINSNYNIFYGGPTNKFRWGGNESIQNIADWVTASGEDGNSKYQNPLFVSTNNLSLLTNSPAINAGTNVGLTTDYAGNPIVGIPDIGAYEYQGTIVSTPPSDITPPAAPTGLMVN